MGNKKESKGNPLNSPMLLQAGSNTNPLYLRVVLLDISRYNASAGVLPSYATFAAALAAVPAQYHLGGLAVRFINSVTEQYEQYRLLSPEWSTTESDWVQEDVVDATISSGSPGQILALNGDGKPTWVTVQQDMVVIDNSLSEVSQNPVENRVITGALGQLGQKVFGIDGNATAGYYLNSSNELVEDENCGVSDYIPVPAGDFQVYYSSGGLSGKYLIFVNDDNQKIAAEHLNNVEGKTVSIPTEATKFRFSFDLSYDNVRCAYLANVFYRPIISTDSLEEKIQDVQNNVDLLTNSLSSLRNAGYVYGGIIYPSSSPESNENVFYLASTKGIYVNFGNIELNENDVAFIKKVSGVWRKEYTAIKRRYPYFNNTEFDSIFNELFVSPTLNWNGLYVKITDLDATHWRFTFGENTSFSPSKVKDVLKSETTASIISIDANDSILFSVNPALLISTPVMEGYIDIAKNIIFAPACAAYLYNKKLSDSVSSLDTRVVLLETKASSLDTQVNGIIGNCTDGYYLNSQNQLVADENHAVSDYINVPAGAFQIYYSNNVSLVEKYLCFVNDSNELINAVQQNVAGGLAVDIPSGATKFRFTFVKDYSDARASYLSIPFYIPVHHVEGIAEKVDELNGKLSHLDEQVDGHQGNAKDGCYLNYSGQEVADDNWIVSDFINVAAGITIAIYYSNQNEPGHYMVEYDGNDNVLTRTNLNGGNGAMGGIVLNEQTAKIRCSFKKGYKDARIASGGVTLYLPDVTILSILAASKEYTDNAVAGLKVTARDALMFSLIDDDFRISSGVNHDADIANLERFVALCETLGIRCSFALIPDYESDKITPSTPAFSAEKLAMVQDFQERGFSFAMHPNHSLYYMDDTPGTLAQCEKCLVKTQQAFIDNKILGAEKILVWPGSSDTRDGEMLVPMAARHVEIGIHAGEYGNLFYNTVGYFQAADSRYKMVRMALDFSFYTKTQMKENIDAFVANGAGLMIFTSHIWQFLGDDVTVDETTPSWPNFVEVLTYAVNKGITFTNMNEVYMRKIQTEYIPTLIAKRD